MGCHTGDGCRFKERSEVSQGSDSRVGYEGGIMILTSQWISGSGLEGDMRRSQKTYGGNPLSLAALAGEPTSGGTAVKRHCSLMFPLLIFYTTFFFIQRESDKS